MHGVASHGKTKPAIRGLRDNLEHVSARSFRVENHSHSMINAVLKHYKINKIELSLHVDTIQKYHDKKTWRLY